MNNWRIEIKFQAPRGAVIKEGVTDEISDALARKQQEHHE